MQLFFVFICLRTALSWERSMWLHLILSLLNWIKVSITWEARRTNATPVNYLI
jgi:hypothetical protein